MSRSDVLRALASQICTLERPHPLRVAIDGVAAAGKTTLADELVDYCEPFGRALIRASTDDFHRPRAERYVRGRYSPEGYYHDTTDYAALREALLEPLGPGGSREYRVAWFDLRSDTPVAPQTELAGETDLLLLDGLFLLRPELRTLWDFSIYLEIGADTSWSRGLARARAEGGGVDELEGRRLERERYRPGHELYLRDADPAAHASAVLDNTDLADPRLR